MKWRLIVSNKPVKGDTIKIDGVVTTFDGVEDVEGFVVEAEKVSDTLTDANSYWEILM